MLDLNLFEHDRIKKRYIDSAISKIKRILKNVQNERKDMTDKDNILDEFIIYEKKKLFLDNKSRRGNDLAWVMDENSVCVSEAGDGGPMSINDITLPTDIKIGEVYEKINGSYVYNEEITETLSKIM